MFTGLVEALGTLRRVTPANAGRRLVIAEPRLAPEAALGDSIAVNGVCLTVVEREADALHFEAGPETLSRTNLGELQPRDQVNLEGSLRATDRLGGHLVLGHVDGVGVIAETSQQANWTTVWFECAKDLARQMVPKGSVAVDGVSLTLVEVHESRFSVALIPHTLAHTTLGTKQSGARVNLETDLVGKYVWKYLEGLGLSRLIRD